jgi:hypothetical protein
VLDDRLGDDRLLLDGHRFGSGYAHLCRRTRQSYERVCYREVIDMTNLVLDASHFVSRRYSSEQVGGDDE